MLEKKALSIDEKGKKTKKTKNTDKKKERHTPFLFSFVSTLLQKKLSSSSLSLLFKKKSDNASLHRRIVVIVDAVLLLCLLVLCSSPLLCEERTRARLRLFVRVLSSRPVRVRDEKTYVQRRGPAVVHDEHVRLKRGELSRQWVTQRGRDEYCDVFGLFVRVLQRLQLSDVDYERVSFGRHTAVHAVRVLVEVLLVPRPGGA